MNKDPFVLFEGQSARFLPGIFFAVVTSIWGSNFILAFEAVAHCFEFIEEGFVACILDQVHGWDFLIASVIKFPKINGYKSREATLNTQTYKCNVSTLATLQLLDTLLELLLAIYSVLTIRNEHNSDRGSLLNIRKSFLQQLEGIQNISHTSAIFLNILIQVGMFLKPGSLTESNQEVSLFCYGLVPELGHILPERTHAPRSINHTNNHFGFIGASLLGFKGGNLK